MCVCVCVCVCVRALILLVFNVCASNTVHGQCLLLAPSVRGPQMVCVIVCVCVCVCVWTKCSMHYAGIYPHISSFRAMSAYTNKGNIHFYPRRFADTPCACACVISGYARIVYMLSSFHPYTKTHTHTL